MSDGIPIDDSAAMAANLVGAVDSIAKAVSDSSGSFDRSFSSLAGEFKTSIGQVNVSIKTMMDQVVNAVKAIKINFNITNQQNKENAVAAKKIETEKLKQLHMKFMEEKMIMAELAAEQAEAIRAKMVEEQTIMAILFKEQSDAIDAKRKQEKAILDEEKKVKKEKSDLAKKTAKEQKELDKKTAKEKEKEDKRILNMPITGPLVTPEPEVEPFVEPKWKMPTVSDIEGQIEQLESELSPIMEQIGLKEEASSEIAFQSDSNKSVMDNLTKILESGLNKIDASVLIGIDAANKNLSRLDKELAAMRVEGEEQNEAWKSGDMGDKEYFAKNEKWLGEYEKLKKAIEEQENKFSLAYDKKDSIIKQNPELGQIEGEIKERWHRRRSLEQSYMDLSSGIENDKKKAEPEFKKLDDLKEFLKKIISARSSTTKPESTRDSNKKVLENHRMAFAMADTQKFVNNSRDFGTVGKLVSDLPKAFSNIPGMVGAKAGVGRVGTAALGSLGGTIAKYGAGAASPLSVAIAPFQAAIGGASVIMASFNAIMSSSATIMREFGSMMSKVSPGLVEQFEIVANDLEAVVGNAMIPAFKEYMAAQRTVADVMVPTAQATSGLYEALAKTYRVLVDTFMPLYSIVVTMLAPVFEYIVELMNELLLAIKPIIDAFTAILIVIWEVIKFFWVITGLDAIFKALMIGLKFIVSAITWVCAAFVSVLGVILEDISKVIPNWLGGKSIQNTGKGLKKMGEQMLKQTAATGGAENKSVGAAVREAQSMSIEALGDTIRKSALTMQGAANQKSDSDNLNSIADNTNPKNIEKAMINALNHVEPDTFYSSSGADFGEPEIPPMFIPSTS